MPLVRPETLRLLLDHHTAQSAAVTVLTAHPSDPVGYGRVLRDMATGRVQVIVQDDEATSGQRIGDEVAGGALCFRDAWFWPNLVRLEKHADGEFYLSDLVAMACTQGELVTALPTTDPLEVLRLDNRLKLAQAEAEMRRRINERWMLAGVSLVHPEVTYIEVDVDIGTDTV
jgi:bifunctional UDP-N-acetylglucosamine pyrophosphorylase/glucosamine-1-phosphate N-acetyltransferase